MTQPYRARNLTEEFDRIPLGILRDPARNLDLEFYGPRSDTIRAGLRHSELGSFQVGCEPRCRCRASVIPRGAHGLSRVPFHGQLGELGDVWG